MFLIILNQIKFFCQKEISIALRSIFPEKIKAYESEQFLKINHNYWKVSSEDKLFIIDVRMKEF